MSRNTKQDNWAVPVYALLQPKERVAETDERDKAYYDLAQTKGWEMLRDDIQTMIETLDDVVKLENARSIEEFGFMVLARDLTKTYLKHVIRIVEDARSYIEQQSGE